ncbi:MAG: hypothetical protein K0A93_00685 [Desulfuromonadaceae bacterium]|nr:hypothetical protein [Desulfuromonadaceae bacterium]
MNEELNIFMSWERLEEGSQAEKSCFGQLNIAHRSRYLSEGIDGYVNRLRNGPLVSGYHFAQWIAWNWWRLVSEPKPLKLTPEWGFAHSLSSIGEGYIWPRITIFSDRERTVLLAKPTQPEVFTPFRFTADMVTVIPTSQFEAAIDKYIAQILGQLRSEGVTNTSLDNIWEEVLLERKEPDTALIRRLEALLGVEPGELDDTGTKQIWLDAFSLGHDAIFEIAAGHKNHGVLTSEQIENLAKTYGRDTKQSDYVRLSQFDHSQRASMPAWKCGVDAAASLREQERLGQGPLSNDKLAEMCATTVTVLNDATDNVDFAFSMDDIAGSVGKVVLRSKWEAGRRFELARLLGDRLTNCLDERLLPATRSYTYRQKLQRAFAAELLCPYGSLIEKLDGDFSGDAREDAAHYFNVSERTVTTLLVNHRDLDQDYLEDIDEIAI